MLRHGFQCLQEEKHCWHTGALGVAFDLHGAIGEVNDVRVLAPGRRTDEPEKHLHDATETAARHDENTLIGINRRRRLKLPDADQADSAKSITVDEVQAVFLLASLRLAMKSANV